MKIIIFSDSHGVSYQMESIISQHSPDLVIHLGDGFRDALEMEKKFPQTAFKLVQGNCDLYCPAKDEDTFFAGRFKIFTAHGHKYHVKQGLDHITMRCRELGADLGLFGHTHRPYYTQTGSFHLLNPGSAALGSWALADLSDSLLQCRLMDFD